jgi:hypothetical protein
MIKRIKKALFQLRILGSDGSVRAERGEFNGKLLDQRREEAFVLMHQQMAGLH